MKGSKGAGGRIIGKYRGYRLELDTFVNDWKRYNRIYTSLTLFGKSRPTEENGLDRTERVLSKKVTPKDIVSMLAPSGLHYKLKGKININPKARQIYYNHRGIEKDAEYLQFLFDLLSDIMDNYLKVLGLGGEIALDLQSIANDESHALQPIAIQLLRDMAQETKYQVRPKVSRLLCSRCLTRCHTHKVRLPWWDSVTYYGCRSCGQSIDFLDFGGPIVVRLDYKTPIAQSEQNGMLYINRFSHDGFFDFDQVQIIHATDEDVERFTIQVGNDTDPVRLPRYNQMTCTIAPDCQLSENTMRILRRTFGEVEVKQ